MISDPPEHPGTRAEFRERNGVGRVRFALADGGEVEDAIEVEKDDPSAAGACRTDSHLVARDFKSGRDAIERHPTL